MQDQTSRAATARLPVVRSLTLAYALSLAVAAIMTVTALTGILFANSVYPTDELRQSFVPTDVVNLGIGVPILLASLWLARRDQLVGLLLWPGALFYVFYIYIAYAFGLPLNALFPLSLTLVVLSAYTMVGLVASIDGAAVRRRLAGAVPERPAAAVLVGLGVLFLLRAAVMLVTAVIDQTPMARTELAALVADFVTAPATIIGGALLWRRVALGYVSAMGLLFQTSMLFIGLILLLLLQPLLTAAPFAPVDVVVVFVLGLICFVPAALFLRGAVSRRDVAPT